MWKKYQGEHLTQIEESKEDFLEEMITGYGLKREEGINK